ncbi:hypothetical protein [Cognataquiflexum rubidum]|uniref:hypothetical protein n=1 Tax=Cognataquiflexum rubidum TaxID=2922273 RepID=UPI001F147268|nr:hypothetical protein [Cognataquiflexum rubidum]MCH6235819.1 hypothetical protein [Cognataquiflexum rubidum]
MKLNSNVRIYLILFFFVILGYVFMIVPDLFLPPPSEGELSMKFSFIFQFSVLTLILITNFVTAYKFKLKKELTEFWSIKKISHFPIGILVGVSVMSVPIIFGILSGKAAWSDLKFVYDLSGLEPIAIIFTLIITLWEELWYRGIFLNYAKRYLSIIQISLFMGLLFMISYSLYSKGNFLMVSPNFLLLGILFILMYFYFKTNWLTYGMMLGINIATASSPFENDWLIGRFGLLSALLWGILLLWIIKKYDGNLNKKPLLDVS